MIRKIICKDYASAMQEIFRLIGKRKKGLGIKNYLIVPDNYTLYAEKELCNTEGGYFDINVISFNRLFFSLCKEKPLGRAQAVMIIRSILPELKLECFVKSSKYRGFADKIYDTLILLKKNGITPDKLRETKASDPKFRDIALIYEKYLEKSVDYADASSRIRLLRAAIEEKEFFKGADVFAANFDLITEDERELLDYISETADNFVFTYSLPVSSLDDVTDNVEVMSASGSAEQLKEIALRIADAAYKGVSYEDMCVVCPGECKDHIQRIFGEYDIPYYLDYKYRFSLHPLPRYIISLLNTVKKGLRKRDVLELVKNPYFGADKTQCDIFELYCEKFCVDYKGFEASFEDKNCEYCTIAEEVRKRLMEKVARVRRLGKNQIPAYLFSEFIKNEVIAASEAGREFDTEIGIDSVAELTTVADFISGITERADIGLLTDIFEDGVDAVEIATLPNLSGSVSVGDVSAFRGQHFRYMFVTDFNDEILPKKSEESGIISDYDIVSSALKIITASETNARHRSELCMLLSSADKLFLSFDNNRFGGKSFMLKSLIMKKGIKPFCRNDELNVLYNDKSILPLLAGTKPAAEELLLGAVSEYSLFGDYRGNVRDFVFPLYTALGRDVEKYFIFDDKHELEKDTAVRLFSSSALSVSRISSFYKCPYMHFMSYGLRLTPIERGEIRANDVGDILHKVAERFVGEYKGGDIGKFVEILLREITQSHIKKDMITDSSTYEFLLDEAIRGCEVLASHFASGEFVTMGEELSFGYSSSSLKSVEIDMGGRKVPLCGKIDYVDLWKDFARVIDYKTGSTVFDLKTFYYGTNIQLAIYSYVLGLNGYKPAGIFLFPFRIGWSTEEKDLLFNGLFDKGLLCQMDTGFYYGDYKSKVVNASVKTLKSGAQKLYSSSATNGARLKGLGEYAFRLAVKSAELMAEGYAEIKPYRDGELSPCSYCDYKPICRYNENNGFRSFKRKKLEDFTEDKDGVDR